MRLKKKKDNRKTTAILAAVVILGIVLAWRFFISNDTGAVLKNNQPQAQTDPATISQPIEKPEDSGPEKQDTAIIKGEIHLNPPLDYNELEKDATLKEMMETRKEASGLGNSLDMIVKSDESIIIGGSKVSMREILEKAFTQTGEVYQEAISESGGSHPGKIREYGVHVVQPGDNIWNIHFNILKAYYAHKGIKLSTKADEPVNGGVSSGVGKILKFSETMVIIYDLTEKKVVENISLIEPLSKIVVYNMKEVFTLLEEISYDSVDRIQFDGKNIWIPARKS
ncbi:MAG: hypothetical protein KKC20_17600 [Proteobacteria bacterium]|nr:hypothetical protein [Pseudomonadota bacterium]